MNILMQKLINNLLHDPRYTLNVILALIRGTFYSLWYRLFTKNVRIKLPFKAFTKVRIIGPGSVLIEKNCSAGISVFKGLTIVTISANAIVKIGINCQLEGLTIRCKNRVELGERAITAISLVQDFLFVNTNNGSYADSVSANAQIVIGKNVWLSGDAILLHGSQIGDDCVIGAKSLCQDINLASYSLAIGSPVKRGIPIENLLKLKGAM